MSETGILKKIPEIAGKDIFNDAYRFYAIAEDLAAGSETQFLHMLEMFVTNHLFSYIKESYNCKESSRRIEILKEAEDAFLRNCNVGEEKSEAFFLAFCEAYNWKNIKFRAQYLKEEKVRKEKEQKEKEQREREQKEREQKEKERKYRERIEKERKEEERRKREKKEAEAQRIRKKRRAAKRRKRIVQVGIGAAILAGVIFSKDKIGFYITELTTKMKIEKVVSFLHKEETVPSEESLHIVENEIPGESIADENNGEILYTYEDVSVEDELFVISEVEEMGFFGPDDLDGEIEIQKLCYVSADGQEGEYLYTRPDKTAENLCWVKDWEEVYVFCEYQDYYYVQYEDFLGWMPVNSIDSFEDQVEEEEIWGEISSMENAVVVEEVFQIGEGISVESIPSVSENGIHRYDYLVEDCTWNEAFERAKNKGGYLVHINDMEEYGYILAEISNRGLTNIQFRVGAKRNEGSEQYFWVDENNNTYGDILNAPSYWLATQWLSNEPSFHDGDIQEYYLEFFYMKNAGRWVWNDVEDDILKAVPGYSGKIGYIVEYDY